MLFEHLRQNLAEVDAPICSKEPDVPVELVEDQKSVQAPPLDNIVCPVLTLPPELTSKIFTQCAEFGPPTEPFPYGPRLDSTSAILSNICREWRSIALITPFLWTANLRWTADFDVRRQRVTYFHKATRHWGDITQYCEVCFARQCLPFGAPPALMDDLNLYSIAEVGPLPVLRALTLSRYRNSGDTTALRVINTFDAPLLREVSLKRGILPGLVRLPWAQLTSFACEGLSLDDCARILRDCPTLKTCTFTDIISDGSGILSHPRLESLTIGLGRHLLAGVQIRAFPALRKLSLEGWPEDEVHAFLLALNRVENTNFLPRLSSLQVCQRPLLVIDTPVTDALRSRYTYSNDIKLEYLCLLYDFNQYKLSWDEIGDVDWDSLYDLWDLGMDIHVGQKGDEENFLFEE
ncbi:hypothetical protein C8R43DRAFT_1231133 [Mycena crocata]|nr:hypothetical protein C8R43DRAFT_1231133 [Mycena crocata]